MTHLNVIVKLTSRCNMTCEYCFHTKTNIDLNLDGFKAFLTKLTEEVTSLHIILHGGEPLLYGYEKINDLLEFIEELKLDKLAISLQTNGTLYNDKWNELFVKHSVSVSYSNDSSVSNIRSQQPASLPNNALPITVIHRNNVKDIVQIYEELKQVSNERQLCFNLAYQSTNSDMTLLPEQNIVYLDFIKHLLTDTSPNATTERNVTEYLNKIVYGNSELCTESCRGCWLTVTANGDIYSCDRETSSVPLSNIVEFSTLNLLFKSKLYCDCLQTTETKREKCSGCDYMDYCTRKCTIDISHSYCELSKQIIRLLMQMICDGSIENKWYLHYYNSINIGGEL